jgi:hypothetical protein
MNFGRMPPNCPPKPPLPSHLALFWDAFSELSSDRQSGMGLGQIPFTAIDRYAGRYGIEPGAEFEAFKYLIRRMDATYLEESAPKKEVDENVIEHDPKDVRAVQGMLSRVGKR